MCRGPTALPGTRLPSSLRAAARPPTRRRRNGSNPFSERARGWVTARGPEHVYHVGCAPRLGPPSRRRLEGLQPIQPELAEGSRPGTRLPCSMRAVTRALARSSLEGPNPLKPEPSQGPWPGPRLRCSLLPATQGLSRTSSQGTETLPLGPWRAKARQPSRCIHTSANGLWHT